MGKTWWSRHAEQCTTQPAMDDGTARERKNEAQEAVEGLEINARSK